MTTFKQLISFLRFESPERSALFFGLSVFGSLMAFAMIAISEMV